MESAARFEGTVRIAAGFTIVELIVVITVVVLILALAVPGLSAMQAEARLSAASQIINRTVTRAFYLAIGDVNMTAVRFCPGEWDSAPEDESEAPIGRQHLAIYSYTGLTYNPDYPGSGVVFKEFFTRRDDLNSIRLPQDVWAAPLEAYYDSVVPEFVLDGEIGEFTYDAGDDAGVFLNADDFMIVIDPKVGVLGGVPQPFRMRAYDPGRGRDAHAEGGNGDLYQRYGFSGVVIYPREPFVAVENNGELRRNLLLEKGRPYMAHRYSGGLTAGMLGSE